MSKFLIILLKVLFAVLVASQSRTSYLTVYILPPASSTIFASCWSNTSSGLLTRNFSYAGEFTWTVPVASYPAYWCRARSSSNILVQFPIFGDGVERNSSEWLVDSRGKRRLSLNGKLLNDNIANWLVT